MMAVRPFQRRKTWEMAGIGVRRDDLGVGSTQVSAVIDFLDKGGGYKERV